MAVAALGACSLTSLAGLTSADSDGGTGSSTGEVTSSSGGPLGGGSSGGSSSGATASSSGGGSSGGTGDNEGVLSEPNDDGDASTDASGPGPQMDASQTNDTGATDAASGGGPDSAPTTFCASLSPAPLFCDDFDEGIAVASPWDQLSNTDGAEQLSTSSYVSAPDAMLVTVNPNSPVTSIDVAGYKSFTAKQGVTGTAKLSFDIRIDAADESSNSDAILGAIQLWNGSAYWDLEFEVFYASASGDFTISLSEDGNGSASYVKHAVGPHLALATWTTVTLGIALPAGSGGATTGTMALNGTTVTTATVHVTTSNPIPEILVGTTYATPTSGGWSVAYDNVIFDEQ